MKGLGKLLVGLIIIGCLLVVVGAPSAPVSLRARTTASGAAEIDLKTNGGFDPLCVSKVQFSKDRKFSSEKVYDFTIGSSTFTYGSVDFMLPGTPFDEDDKQLKEIFARHVVDCSQTQEATVATSSTQTMSLSRLSSRKKISEVKFFDSLVGKTLTAATKKQRSEFISIVSPNSIPGKIPEITLDLQPKTLTPKQDILFRVNATGTKPLKYDWYMTPPTGGSSIKVKNVLGIEVLNDSLGSSLLIRANVVETKKYNGYSVKVNAYNRFGSDLSSSVLLQVKDDSEMPTPTPTINVVTPTSIPTVTPSATATVEATKTSISTPTKTNTPTKTASSTITPSRTPNNTNTATRTPTSTNTSGVSCTPVSCPNGALVCGNGSGCTNGCGYICVAGPTITSTPTKTATASNTPTRTATASNTPTRTTTPENGVVFPIAACGIAPCEFPTEANTGLLVPKSSLRVVTSTVNSVQDGQIIEKLWVKHANIIISHDNVTVRNVFMDNGAIKLENDANNFLIEHNELTIPNYGSGNNDHLVLRNGGAGTIKFNYAYENNGDFVKAGSNQIYECNYVKNLSNDPNSHADVIQFQSTTKPSFQNTTFRFNNFQTGPIGDSVLIAGNPLTNITFECNWQINGGNKTFYMNEGSVNLRNNLLGRDAKGAITTGMGADDLACNNIYFDTGELAIANSSGCSTNPNPTSTPTSGTPTLTPTKTPTATNTSVIVATSTPTKTATPNGASITVISPNGGQSYNTGINLNISWSYRNLSSGGTFLIQAIPENPAARQLNTTLSNTITPSLTFALENAYFGQYKIKITAKKSDGTIEAEDFSDNFFTVIAPPTSTPTVTAIPTMTPTINPNAPSIRVTSPNGGEVYNVGSTIWIRWTAQNLSSGGRIAISVDSPDGHSFLYSPLPPNTSTSAPIDLTSAYTHGQYKIRLAALKSDNTTEAGDISDSYFTVVPLITPTPTRTATSTQTPTATKTATRTATRTPTAQSNLPPLVNAGTDIALTLPNNFADFSGTVSDPEGQPVNLLWSQVSGPSTASMAEINSENAVAFNLVAGIYVFKLTATDSFGASTTDQVQVTVNPVQGSGPFQENNGLLIIESENTSSDLGSGDNSWKAISQGEANYVDNATNSKHLEFQLASETNDTVKRALSYSFKINKTGYYQLHIRSRARLDGAADDKHNDAFVKVAGLTSSDVFGPGPNPGTTHESQASYSLLSNFTKLYVYNAPNSWGWAEQLDAGGTNNKRWPIYQFNAGQTYVLSVAGRSRLYNMDRIVFRHAGELTNIPGVAGSIAKNPANAESCRTEGCAVVNPTPLYKVGDRVRLTKQTNVRSAPILSSATLLGAMPAEALATLIAGPVAGEGNGYTWWNVEFDGSSDDSWGPTKYIGEDNFELTVGSILTPTPTPIVTATATAVVTPTISVTPPAGSCVADGGSTIMDKVTVKCNGPTVSETDSANPFYNYRMDVTFTKGSKSYVVPGYFAADGDAANSSATSGNQFHALFRPDESGTWSYAVSFRTGEKVAIGAAGSGTATAFNGAAGNFTVGTSSSAAVGKMANGRLKDLGNGYIGGHLNNKAIIKLGPGTPENFLGYSEFDAPKSGSTSYSAHVTAQDWKTGDPTWKVGKGKGIIGVLNYLASTGSNALYFMFTNIDSDNEDVTPHLGDYSTAIADRYDVSKLAQWHIVFEHANKLGIILNMFFHDDESGSRALFGSAGDSDLRKLYFREMIARFGNLPLIQYDISEEYNKTAGWAAEAVKAGDIIRSLDPYKQIPVSVHTTNVSNGSDLFNSFAPKSWFSPITLQLETSDPVAIGSSTEHWLTKGKTLSGGRTIPVSIDEPQSFSISSDPTKAEAMSYALIFSGGWGLQLYEGTSAQDAAVANFRTANTTWTRMGYARKFAEDNLPLGNMQAADSIDSGASGTPQVFKANDGSVYAVYYPDGSNPGSLNFGSNATRVLRWYNPRLGQFDATGAVNLTGSTVTIPDAPSGSSWVALITN